MKRGGAGGSSVAGGRVAVAGIAPIAAVIAMLIALAASACSTPSALAPGLSGSVGVPHAGFLTNGRELPQEGRGWRWRSTADHHYGVPRLVRMVEDAAASVADARVGTPPLFVGDLSSKGGGALMPKHRSHRTGRDVDLLFYATSLDGAPIPGASFAKFGADGIGVSEAGRFVRFDVEREWLLVRALVESRHAHVQWIFIARVLEALLIEHAIARGEQAALVARAARLMVQPGDSLPHDDHAHVRIACEAEELVTGCEGGGPRWPWLPAPKRFEAPSSELVDALLGPAVRARPRDEAGPIAMNP